MALQNITIRGARQHNLKNIGAVIPRNALTVITGLSGSGKSSLAFDTLYAEGQRRYCETLSAYARQFLDQMERPDVDAIEGLSPAIAIEQKTTSRSPRSTVGTITEIYDFLRLLWASVGTPRCPRCGRAISRQSAEQIVETLLAPAAASGGEPARVTILAPVARGRKGEFRKELEAAAQQGFSRARIDGELRRLDEEDEIRLDKRKNHTIEIVVDRIVLRPGAETRLAASVATAMKLADGLVVAAPAEGPEQLYSGRLACPDCGVSVPALEPRSFSFNSAYGACPACHGLGSRYEFDAAKAIVDWNKPLFEGGLGPGSASAHLRRQAAAFARERGIALDKPLADLPRAEQKLILEGEPGRRGFSGVLGYLRQLLEDVEGENAREYLLGFTSPVTCPECLGRRLRPESLAVTVQGLSIADFAALSIAAAAQRAESWRFTGREALIAARLIDEIRQRLRFLLNVGLGYLSLDRAAGTLSGGEAQRIRLAGQIGSQLRGVLYVLDEPSIGLHPRDNGRLLDTLARLRDLGNTVIVVEHDQETIERADHVLDLGPGAGRHGGELVAAGTPAQIAANPGSLTGRYLAGALRIPLPARRRAPRPGQALTIVGARAHNLKNVDVAIPAGLFTVLTGVSGAGKSTLVNGILFPALMRKLHGSAAPAGPHQGLRGAEAFDKAIRIDQAPIGRTPRSNPATYAGVFTPIRELFARLPEARERGYKPGRFSFNVRGGRCEACQGEGQRRIEMNFLPDVFVRCEVCRGRRYNQETLAVRYRGHSIADLLEMPIQDALEVFAAVPQIEQKLHTMVEVGLGYLQLGQSSTTLSGGEAQRIKIAKELSRRQTGRTLYLLEEPTTGLHFDDIRKLLEVLNRLVDLGNTVLVIEHNLDVIKSADWIIDLGPEGGEAGGRLVAQGPPEAVAEIAASYTGAALRTLLAAASKTERAARQGA
ncbi:MAG: excinuclease ABC subunit UvrA [Terriglobales bacterium]